MVSGEGVSIAIKCKTAISRIWKVPGMLCGNILPRWMDPGGAISRRVLLLGFENYVIHSDPLLARKLLDEAAAFLCKCNRAYLWSVRNYRDKNIWDSVPQYFRDKQQELIESSNQLVNFITHCAELKRDVEAYMLENDFIQMLNRFMKEKQLGKFVWKEEYFSHVLPRYGLRLEKSTRRWNGQDIHAQWIVGIGLHPNSINNLHQMSNGNHPTPVIPS
jgi:phage/plasmid-associated DNA primase